MVGNEIFHGIGHRARSLLMFSMNVEQMKQVIMKRAETRLAVSIALVMTLFIVIGLIKIDIKMVMLDVSSFFDCVKNNLFSPKSQLFWTHLFVWLSDMRDYIIKKNSEGWLLPACIGIVCVAVHASMLGIIAGAARLSQ